MDVNSSFDSFGIAVTPLTAACYRGHLNIVQWLVQNTDADVNKADKYGVTPLTVACEYGNIEVVNWLIENTLVDINKKGSGDRSPLVSACYNAWGNVTQILLVEGLVNQNVNIIDNRRNSALHYTIWCNSDNGLTSLHRACLFGLQREVSQLIYVNDASVNVQNNEGDTPLHLACLHGYSDIVEIVMMAGANETIANDNMLTAADLAKRKGHTNLLDLLNRDKLLDIINKRRTAETQISNKWKIIYSIQLFHNFCLRFRKHNYTWYHSLMNVHFVVSVIKNIKKKVVLPNAESSSSDNKLKLTKKDTYKDQLLNAAHRGQLESVTDLSMRFQYDKSILNESLRIACWKGNLNVVKWMVEHTKADANDRGVLFTPLTAACWMGHEDIVRYLVDSAHIDVNLPDTKRTSTPLTAACLNLHTSITKYLLAKSQELNVNIPDSKGNTPLHYVVWSSIDSHMHLHNACEIGDLQQITAIVYSCKDINHINGIDKNGNTPLHLAAAGSHYDSVALLLSLGGDTSIVNDDKKTPLEMVQEKDYVKLNKIMQEF